MSMSGTQPTEAGWYPDPAGSGGQRFYDGEGWTAQVTTSVTSRVKPLGPGFAVLGDWVARLLTISGVLFLIAGGVLFYAWATVSADDIDVAITQSADGTTVANGGVATSGTIWLIVFAAALTVLVLLTTGIVFLVWQVRLASTAPGHVRRSAGWHLADWFIPFLNWWRPRSDLADLWGAYGSQARGQTADPVPATLSLWWAMYVALPFIGGLFAGGATTRVGTEGGVMHIYLALYAVLLVGQGLGGFALRSYVHDLSWRALIFWSALD